MTGVNITWEVKLDTKRDKTFNGTYDDISSYVIGVDSSAGFTQGQDAFHAISEPVAPPAKMQIKLDNRTRVFHQETLGSEVLNNGGFGTWAGGNPSSWTVTGEVGANPEISQVSLEQSHGGGGIGACNIYSTSATVSISQTTLVVNTTYKLTITIGKVMSGVISVFCGATKIGVYGEEGTFTEYFVAGSTTLKVQNQTANCDVTVDSISAKATARYTGLLRPGILLRFRATYGSTQQLFIGKITEGGISYGINDKSGSIDGQTVTVVAQDAMLDLVDIEYVPPILTDVTTGAVLQRMFDDATITWPYSSTNWMMGVSGASELDNTTYLADVPDTDFEDGQTTFVFAGNVSDNGRGVQAQQYIRDVATAEGGGRFYFNPRTGIWIFQDRHHDPLLTTVSATLDVTALDSADYVYGDDLVNAVTLNYTAREVGGAGSTIYTSKTNPIRVDAQSVRKITGRYLAADTSNKRIGAYNFLPINSPQTYSVARDAANTLPPIGNYTISAEGGAASVVITIDNQTAAPIYVFNLTFKGTPLIWYEESVNYSDPHSVRKYDQRNKQPMSIKMIDDTNFAYALCQFIVNRYGTPQSRFASITFTANLNATLAGHMINRSIGDRITLTSTYMNHNADYVIIGESHALDTTQRKHVVTWYLKPLSREIVWTLDRVGKAELGVNTYLGL